MQDNEQLQQLLHSLPANSLWCIGEDSDPQRASGFGGICITNRFDVFRQAQQAGLICHFNDFDLSLLADNSLDAAVWRIAKEKLLNIHVIVSSLSKLKHGGKLYLIGYRNEGIESLLSLLQTKTNAHIERQKLKKQLQQVCISKPSQLTIDNSYPNLQQPGDDDQAFYSKPGVFGWNKTDTGSQLLIQVLAGLPVDTQHRVLDLGCGYGYLAMQAHQLGYRHIDATDNNAAAIVACQANYALHNIQGQVIADDCAAAIDKRYDLIVCNPPFHQGFAHDKALTTRFCQTASRLLNNNGQALFVVNQFIGLEKVASSCFGKQRTLFSGQGFKVLCLSK